MYNDILDFKDPKRLHKKIALLEAIEREGSISKAAKTLPISYKIAWEMIDEMNNISKEPIVSRSIGGSGGGGTKLTDFGKKVIEDYKKIKVEFDKFIDLVSTTSDIDSIGKLAFRISARNQLFGKIVEIQKDLASAQISFELKSGIVLKSSITLKAAKELELDIGDEVIGIIKASSIMISNKRGFFKKRTNLFEGIVEDIKKGEFSVNIKVDIKGVDKLWISCKKAIVDDMDLKRLQKAYIFIKPKEILLGV